MANKNKFHRFRTYQQNNEKVQLPDDGPLPQFIGTKEEIILTKEQKERQPARLFRFSVAPDIIYYVGIWDGVVTISSHCKEFIHSLSDFQPGLNYPDYLSQDYYQAILFAGEKLREYLNKKSLHEEEEEDQLHQKDEQQLSNNKHECFQSESDKEYRMETIHSLLIAFGIKPGEFVDYLNRIMF